MFPSPPDSLIPQGVRADKPAITATALLCALLAWALASPGYARGHDVPQWVEPAEQLAAAGGTDSLRARLPVRKAGSCPEGPGDSDSADWQALAAGVNVAPGTLAGNGNYLQATGYPYPEHRYRLPTQRAPPLA